MQEAKDSSAIENIITTHDDLYKTIIFEEMYANPASKEVRNYALVLTHGFELVRKNKFLSSNHILKIQEILEQNDAGYRKQTGTTLINLATDE